MNISISLCKSFMFLSEQFYSIEPSVYLTSVYILNVKYDSPKNQQLIFFLKNINAVTDYFFAAYILAKKMTSILKSIT